MSDEPGLLPAVPDEAAVEEMVFDGEVVEEDRAPGLPVPPAPVRAVVVLRPVVQVFQSFTVVVQAPPTRAVARHAAYVPAGAVAIMRRRQQGKTLAHRMAHQLALQGDQDKALLMLQQAEAQRKARHERARGRAETLVLLVKNAHWITLVTVGVMLGTGIAVGNAAWAFTTAAAVIRGLVATVTWGWRVGVFAGPAAAVIWLHEAGRRGGNAPGWSLTAKPGDADRGLVVTADGIVVALQNIPVPDLKKAFKDKWQPAFRLTPVKDGEGYSAVFSVPMGVTPEMIADKNEIFARNLHRASCEVWVTDAERAKLAPAGFVSLYVLNPGVLDRPTPEYPLMHEGQADVFEGVPGGVVARGDGALIPVVANNGVFGGQMGMGKSNAGRVFILGCCTDPLCEVEVFVFANNGDYDAYAPRLATYVKGTDDAVAAAAVQRLHELLDETGRREGRLAELGAKKLTRRIAEQHPDMRPVVVLFSECHELFGHPEYGELAAELAVKVIKRARKTGIALEFDTQSSRAAAIPPALVELVSVNVCFYVKTWRSNDGFLGDGSFQGGIRATELRPARDVGRAVVTGISDAQFELLKWYFVEVDDDTGWDAATEVIARCMRNLAPGTRVMGGDSAALPVIELRDLIADVAEVAGPDRVRLADLPARLRKVAPAYGLYRHLTGVQLRELLEDLGVRTLNPKNVPTLDPADLRQALAGRGELAVPLSRMVPQGLERGLDLTCLTLPPDLIPAGHRAVSSGMAWVRNLTRKSAT